MGRRTSQGEIKAARVSSLIDRSVPDVGAVTPGAWNALGEMDFCVHSPDTRGRGGDEGCWQRAFERPFCSLEESMGNFLSTADGN